MANDQRSFNFNLNDLNFILQQIEFRPLFNLDASGALLPVINTWDGTTAIYDGVGTLLWDPAVNYTTAQFAALAQAALTNYGQLYADATGTNPILNWNGTDAIYNAHGTLIWGGAVPVAGTVQLTAAAAVALFGVSYATASGSVSSSVTDFTGLRDVSGLNNNLVPGQQKWGADGGNFVRVAKYDPNHYVQENLVAPMVDSDSATTLSTGPVVSFTLTDIFGTHIRQFQDQTTETSTETYTVNGHHLAVNQVHNATTTLTATYDYPTGTVRTDLLNNPVEFIYGPPLVPGGNPTVTQIAAPTATTTVDYLTGGELDPAYHGQLGAFDSNNPQNFVKNLTRFASGLNVGAVDVTANTNYAITFDAAQVTATNPLGKIESSVVDYTPRMITQTITQGGSPVKYLKTLDATAVTHDPLNAASVAGYAYNYQSGDGVALLHDGSNHVVYWEAAKYDGAYVAKIEALITANTVTVATLRGLADGAPIPGAPVGTIWHPATYSYSKPIYDNHIDTTALIEGTSVVNTSMALLAGQANGTGGNTSQGDLNLYSGAGYGNLSVVGQHDKQNTDANSLTGHGNHEYFYGNIASIGGNAPNNGWMALFGQFFDHGLDFISKPNTSYQVVIPLAVDDPLYGVIGNDGKPTTSITINRAIVGGKDANNAPTYVNHDSPYIDQSQTYGSALDVTTILREWVQDPNTGAWVPGTRMYDGQTLTNAYTDAFGNSTKNTLPTLNGLRDEIRNHGGSVVAGPREDLTWEDVTAGLRARDATGHVVTGVGAKAVEPLLIDFNPHVDVAHLTADAFTAAKTTAAVATLNASLTGTGMTLTFDGTGLHLAVTVALPGLPVGTYTGFTALSPWLSFADFSIQGTLFGAPNLPALTAAQHAATGDILMASVGDHYIAGDGRANENAGLTSIHHVFHEEHGYQVQNVESYILKIDAAKNDPTHAGAHDYQVAVHVTGAPANGNIAIVGNHYEAAANTVVARDNASGNFFVTAAAAVLAAGQSFVTTPATDLNGNAITNPISAAGSYTDANGMISWDQNKIFNAAKVTVEMEYQHAAVDQYSRAVSPNIQEFSGYSTGKNADISLEFGQAAFRFGHSTLRETIDAMDPSGGITGKIMSFALEKAFLNPKLFADVGPGAIMLGQARQLMNEVDNYITPSLNEGLLGQPLDLGAINIARGRDVGLPTFNVAKTQLGMHAYVDWAHFRTQMVHPESIVTFIAAYNFDGDMTKAQTVLNLNDGVALTAAQQVYANSLGLTAAAQALYAHQFMNGLDGVLQGTGVKGIDKVDLWIGGIAELHVAGGVLGETFDTIFVNQIEKLMDGDRFYYLQRLIDQQFGDEIQNEQMKDLVERTTGVNHLNGNIFTYADKYYDEALKAKIATGFLDAKANAVDNSKLGDLYSDAARTHKAFVADANGLGGHWLDANGVITAVIPTGALFDLWGQKVTDLYNASNALVFSRTSMTWVGTGTLLPPVALVGAALYIDANANADGTSSLTPNFVYIGADQHYYSQILTANAGAANDLAVDNGTNAEGARVLYNTNSDGSAANKGVGIWSVNDTTTAFNGHIGHHSFVIPLNDGILLDGTTSQSVGSGIDPAMDASGNMTVDYNFIFDARPNGTSLNKDGSLDTGADSAEILVGTDYTDYIDMGIGDDTAYGGKGNDFIYGGKGNAGHNTLYGGDGNDFLFGGDAPDLIDGGNGDDWIWGNSSGSSVNGVDQLIGGDGNDHIFGGIGIDKMFGGNGDDYLYGGSDTDPFVFGGDGNDYINGGSGVDVLFGGNGDDIVDGGTGVDQLFGGNGDDILRPGDSVSDVSGNGGGGDVLIGGDAITDTGFDFADYSQQSGSNLTGLSGDLVNQVAVGALPKDLTPTAIGVPRPIINTGTVWSALEGIIGTQVGDHLFGDSLGDIDATVSHGNNWLIGGSGNDLIEGRGGNDVIVGGSIRLDALIGTYARPLGGDAYHAANDYSTNSEGASHRIYTDATLQHNGILDMAGAVGLTYDKHLTELLKSRAYKDYVLGDNYQNLKAADFDATGHLTGGRDGTNDVAVFSGSAANYTVTAVTNPGGVTVGYKVAGISGPGLADGTDLVIGIEKLHFSGRGPGGVASDLTLDTAPVVAADRFFTIPVVPGVPIPVSGNVLANDNGGAAIPANWTVSLVGQAPLHGKVSLNSATGLFTYTPTPGYAGGRDYFMYQASDGYSQSNPTLVTIDTAPTDIIPTGSPLVAAALNASGTAATLTASIGTLVDANGLAPGFPTYQWASSATGVAGSYSPIPTANGPTFTPPIGSDTFYKVIATTHDIFGFVHQVSSDITVELGNGVVNVQNGTTGDDIIIGLQGADNINGGLGNDTVLGFTTGDSVNGGAGTNVLQLTSASDATAASAANNAQIVNIQTISGATMATGMNLNLSAQTDGFTIIGSGNNDTVQGSSGADIIQTGAGNDTIRGFTTGDSVDGGTGTNTLQMTAFGDGGAISAATDGQLVNVQNITAAGASFSVMLNLANQTEGFTITGGNTNDVFTGGHGNDVIDGGLGTNFALYHGAATTHTFARDVGGNLVIGDAGALVDGTDTLTNIQNVQIGAVNYGVAANVGNTFNTSATNALGVGGAANDTFNGVGFGAIIEGGGGSNTIALSATSGGLNAASDFQIHNIQTVTAAGAAAGVTINLANQTEGFTIIGSNNADLITVSQASDVINGGGGIDQVIFSAAHNTYGFGVDGAGNLLVTKGGVTDTLTSVEQVRFTDWQATNIASGTGNITGSNGNDLIIATGVNQTLSGGGSLLSNGGQDTFVF